MPDAAQFLQNYRNEKIAIYGLSIVTEQFLLELGDNYQVVGLLDGYRTVGTLYGKPIFTIEEAVRQGVKLIVVVARPESCKVIAKRIGRICEKYHITLMDAHGADLCAQKEPVYTLEGLNLVSMEQLRRFLDAYDIISVDMFDTLVMRQTLFATDVFELVDIRLRQQGIAIEDFSRKRLEAEKELSWRTVPTLLEIYIYIKDKYALDDTFPERAAETEWTVDRDLIVPRRALCQLLREMYQQGKPVFIVSDSFYSKQQMVDILAQCGITQYTDILTSCDFRTSKTDGLFDCLQEIIQEKTCVHIGDSTVADVEGAERKGIAAQRIYSGLDMFEHVGYFGLWDALDSLSARIQTGIFVSKLFNSPFQSESGDMALTVTNAYDIGFLFFSPIISSFVFWFDRQVQEHGLRNIWFSARDGYLVKRLYDMLGRAGTSIYFLTSRSAALRAGVENDDDIRYVEEMRFHGTLQEQLKERFGIEVSAAGTELQNSGLMTYRQEILSAAAVNKAHYQTYIHLVDMQPGSVAFFDLVARGTVQMYVSRMVERTLKGFYFIQQDEAYMRKYGLDILPFYQESEVAKKGIADNYYILEAVLTSPMPSITGFDSLGRAEYAKETRTVEDIACIQSVQAGIIDYFQIYLKLYPRVDIDCDRRLGEVFLALIHRVNIKDTAFSKLKVEDPFFNRMTDISDLL